ncbi:MAG TPA: NHL repeat-containing protein [Pirellulaceae bacterium]|jgi:sugar lactone lactonase YvrE|nr:NHL repeat-containing protein [Pirellulaceae bacterium]
MPRDFSPALSRRTFVAGSLASAGLALSGCLPAGDPATATEDLYLWGAPGMGDGEFQKPRAMTIDAKDQIYVIDMTGRVQVFTTEGEFLRSWRTPEIYQGKPCGMAISQAGEIAVADTHYFRVLFYTPEGELVEEKTIGGQTGTGPGEFGFLTDVAQDSHGNYYVGEYGERDRIQQFDTDGKFVRLWGGHGREPGQFVRPQGLLMDDDDRLWVADACNHRVQIFDIAQDPPALVDGWGSEGSAPGELRYPYGIIFLQDGNVALAEYGNHRIQVLTRDGKSLGTWGRAGRQQGELHQPWALCQDSLGRLHILDTYNHRVQRIPATAVLSGERGM